MIRFPNLSLGELERNVLETLWEEGALKPSDVHARVGKRRGISVNTVSSALKRLFEKGLLRRTKVSHSYVYSADITRAELQRNLLGSLADQFGSTDDATFLAAFVDLAEEQGEDTLRALEQLVASRLKEPK